MISGTKQKIDILGDTTFWKEKKKKRSPLDFMA